MSLKALTELVLNTASENLRAAFLLQSLPSPPKIFFAQSKLIVYIFTAKCLNYPSVLAVQKCIFLYNVWRLASYISHFPCAYYGCANVTDDIPMFILSAGRSRLLNTKLFSRNLRTDKRISDRQLGFDFNDSVPS